MKIVITKEYYVNFLLVPFNSLILIYPIYPRGLESQVTSKRVMSKLVTPRLVKAESLFLKVCIPLDEL